MIVRPRHNLLGNGCLWLGLNLMFCGFFGVGGWYGYNSWRLVSAGGQVVGEVVEMESHHSDGSTTYSPVVEYVVAGETYTFHGGSSSNPPAYHVGQAVAILYDQGDPGKAQINNGWELWLLPAIFIPIAILGLLIGTGIMAFQVFRRWRTGF